MDTQKIGAYKEIHTLYCPTCRKPKDEVIEALQETCVTYDASTVTLLLHPAILLVSGQSVLDVDC